MRRLAGSSSSRALGGGCARASAGRERSTHRQRLLASLHDAGGDRPPSPCASSCRRAASRLPWRGPAVGVVRGDVRLGPGCAGSGPSLAAHYAVCPTGRISAPSPPCGGRRSASPRCVLRTPRRPTRRVVTTSPAMERQAPRTLFARFMLLGHRNTCRSSLTCNVPMGAESRKHSRGARVFQRRHRQAAMARFLQPRFGCGRGRDGDRQWHRAIASVERPGGSGGMPVKVMLPWLGFADPAARDVAAMALTAAARADWWQAGSGRPGKRRPSSLRCHYMSCEASHGPCRFARM